MERKIHPHVEFADSLPDEPGLKFRTVRFFTKKQAQIIFKDWKLPDKGVRLRIEHGHDYPIYDLHAVPIVKGNSIRYVARYFGPEEKQS